MGLRIVVAADPAAVEYKDVVKADLEADSRVDDVIDVGVQAGDDTLYPHIGIKGAHVIKDGKADRGIFFCGTGMGMAITANKVPGIRACTAHDILLRRAAHHVQRRPRAMPRPTRHRSRTCPSLSPRVHRVHLRPEFPLQGQHRSHRRI
ncbi:ribose 5-phosphate isomerase B [Cutibacterium acnes JCM 18916]|nr:ribose 5-phosphate isomerase B [Cutibacterium acnes JCM 18916]